MLRLSHRASRVFKAFSDDEVIKVLSALTVLGQHDEELLAAMENHLPGEISVHPAVIFLLSQYDLSVRYQPQNNDQIISGFI